MPIITNIYGLPEPLVRGIRDDVEREDKDRSRAFSVTELTRPPLISALARIYSESLIADASEYLWRLYGTSVHAAIENLAGEHGMAELRLTADLDGHEVKGFIDMLELRDDGAVLWDWKTTSMWKAKDVLKSGPPHDWRMQLSIYAWLAARNGQPVRRIRVGMMMRDFRRQKAKDYADALKYPIPFATINILPMKDADVESFISQRIMQIRLNIEALAKREQPVFPCTLDDRYARDTCYAVKKRGTKRAVAGGLHRSLRDAEDHARRLEADAAKAGKRVRYEVEYREGYHMRCAEYCDFAWACPVIRAKERAIAMDKRAMLERAAGVHHAYDNRHLMPAVHEMRQGDSTAVIGDGELDAARERGKALSVEPRIVPIAYTLNGDPIYRVFMPW